MTFSRGISHLLCDIPHIPDDRFRDTRTQILALLFTNSVALPELDSLPVLQLLDSTLRDSDSGVRVFS